MRNWILKSRLWHWVLLKLVRNTQYEEAVPKVYQKPKQQ